MQIIDHGVSFQGPPLAVCIGFFDGVHQGHQFLIQSLKEEARKRGLTPAIVTFRQHPCLLTKPEKCPKMLQTYNERIQKLAKTDISYSYVLDFDQTIRQMGAFEFMEQILQQRLGAKLLVMGHDSRFGNDRSKGFEDFRQYGEKLGIEVVKAQEFAQEQQSINSSVIRQHLLKGEIEQANQLLGAPYRLCGSVVDGQKIGRTIGFPTANLKPCDNQKLVPQDGVYIVRVCVDKQCYKGMLNIGTRPTIDNSFRKSIEVHLFDFNHSIYEQHIEIEFLHFLRHERKMPSLDALIKQLHQDKINAITWLDQQ